MAELENLIAVYRGIDDAVAADDAMVDVAARFFEPYEGGAAVGWIHDLDRLLSPAEEVALGRRDREAEAKVAQEVAEREAAAEAAEAEARTAMARRLGRELRRSKQEVVTPVWRIRARPEALRRIVPTRAEREVADVPPPIGISVERAIVMIQEEPPEGRMVSRTLFALAVLARVDPRFAPGGELHDQFVFALQSFTPGRSEGLAADLGATLLDPGLLDGREQWASFADHAESRGLLRSGTAKQPTPCTDTLVTEDVAGQKKPVSRLYTNVCTKDITEDQVMAFLEPSSWAKCSPLYCSMTKGKTTKGWTTYIEDLSPNCKDPSTGHIIVCLEFKQTHPTPDIWQLDYHMCKGTNGNGKVEDDHGTIVVRRKADGSWCFQTTKYLRFAGVVDGASFSMISCALGYSTYALDLLHTCNNATTMPGTQNAPEKSAPKKAPAPKKASKKASKQAPKSAAPKPASAKKSASSKSAKKAAPAKAATTKSKPKKRNS